MDHFWYLLHEQQLIKGTELKLLLILDASNRDFLGKISAEIIYTSIYNGQNIIKGVQGYLDHWAMESLIIFNHKGNIWQKYRAYAFEYLL